MVPHQQVKWLFTVDTAGFMGAGESTSGASVGSANRNKIDDLLQSFSNIFFLI